MHAVPAAFGLHVPVLHVFLPFLFWHVPFLHFSHSSHSGWHLPDLAASASAKPRRPSTPPRSAPNVKRREPAAVRERARASK